MLAISQAPAGRDSSSVDPSTKLSSLGNLRPFFLLYKRGNLLFTTLKKLSFSWCVSGGAKGTMPVNNVRHGHLYSSVTSRRGDSLLSSKMFCFVALQRSRPMQDPCTLLLGRVIRRWRSMATFGDTPVCFWSTKANASVQMNKGRSLVRTDWCTCTRTPAAQCQARWFSYLQRISTNHRQSGHHVLTISLPKQNNTLSIAHGGEYARRYARQTWLPYAIYLHITVDHVRPSQGGNCLTIRFCLVIPSRLSPPGSYMAVW